MSEKSVVKENYKYRKKYGIAMMIVSSLGFTIMSIFVRLSGDLPSIQKVVFRSGMTLLVSGILLQRGLFGKERKLVFIKNSISNYRAMAFRVIAGTIGILINFYCIDHINLSDVNIIYKFSTIIVLFFAFLFLKERMTKVKIAATVLAFCGVLLVIKPSFSAEVVPYLIALVGSIMAAVAYTSLRALKQSSNSDVIVFLFSLFTTVILLPFVLLHYVPMTGTQVFYLVLAGVFASVGQYGITLAYKFAPASEVSIYSYYAVVFAAIFGMLMFHEFPDILSYIGYFVIFAASYILYKTEG